MHVIDSISEWTGKLTSWLCLVLILQVVLEVVMRYAFGAPQNWSPQLSAMICATITAMGWAYTHRHSQHVRVDVLYNYLRPRAKAIVDVVCNITLFFPLMFMLIYAAASWAQRAWVRHEVLTYTSWFPPATPSRLMVLVALCLFTLQGVVRLIRDSAFLIRNKPL